MMGKLNRSNKMSALCDLISAGLIEKDKNGDVLWVWSYPSVTESQRNLFLRKCGLQADNPPAQSYVYAQFKRNWYYIKTFDVREASNLSKVTFFSLVLVTKDFNPEKYLAFSSLLSKQYHQSGGNPSSMLQSYLSVVTRGACNGSGDENGRFIAKEYDKRREVGGSIKDVISMFGVEIILIYTALMLKKKIVVYHPRVDDLLVFVRTLPAFVWHRQNWSMLHPYIHLHDDELEDLKSSSVYVAGFVEPEVEGRSELYDVFVNVMSKEISVSSQAKASLAMGKLHKDMAMFMVQCAENDDIDDEQAIKDIAVKTKELLNNLKSLATEDEDGKAYISLEVLRERKMPPATENFLYSLAAVEGLVKF